MTLTKVLLLPDISRGQLNVSRKKSEMCAYVYVCVYEAPV